MEQSLNQNVIDALLRKAQGTQGAAVAEPKKKIVPCDLRRSNQLTGDQLATVKTLHEAFARRASGSLSAHLRVAFELELVSVQQLAYRDFLSRAPDLTYFASVHVMPIDARAAVQLDIALAYPIIEVVLGGSVSDAIDPRDLTEIEEQILETVFRLIVQDLHSAWAPVLDLDFQFEQRQRNVQMQSTMLPGEKILCLSFEARMMESSGSLMMVFPAVVANTLLRRLSAQWSYTERIPSRNIRRRLRERMLDGRFVVDLSLPGSPLRVRDLVDLEPGRVLTLPKPAHEPIHLNVAGKAMFLAFPARHGPHRAARIERRIPILPPSARKAES